MSILSLFLGVLVITAAALSDHIPIPSLLNLTAFIIVVCGSLAACLLQFGMRKLLTALKAVTWLIKEPKIDLPHFIEQVSKWSATARSSGTLALEEEIPTVSDPLQRQGLQLLVDNTPPEEFATMLMISSRKLEDEQESHGHVWEAMGGYSPTIGVLGAVMGLIHVMMELNHPDRLGGGIATAFVATVYGVGLANLIALPLGARLKSIAKTLERQRVVVIQGFILLSEGKSAIIIRQTLKNYLDDSDQKKNKKQNGADVEAERASQAA